MKKVLFIAALLFSAHSIAQCSDLFFSEYLEGSSNNKAIEIYNPTSGTIDLSDYVIYRYNNGAILPTDSLFPNGNLAAGDVYVAGNPSAVAGILAVSDTLHTITFYNGDDVLLLKNTVTDDTLDIIGVIGIDPGTNWPVGAGATSEFTLVRQLGIQQGQMDWTIGATEWNVFPQNMIDSLGFHTMTPCTGCVPTTASIVVSACTSYTSPSGMYTWLASGVYADTIPNAAGCDSIISFDLTIGTAGSSIAISECVSYTSPSGLYTWTNSGMYADTIPSAAGCDSIISIDLTIGSSASTFTVSACDSYVSPSGNYTWTTTGLYADTIPNAGGCDSIMSIYVVIPTIDLGVTQVAETLTADQSTGTYQWIDCISGLPISGETNQSFTAMMTGVYAVVLSDSGCVDTSACVNVNVGNVVENDFGQALRLSPNPTAGAVKIELGKQYTSVSTSLYTVNGQLIATESFAQTSEMAINIAGEAGIYFLVIEAESGERTQLKVVKH